MTYLPSCYQPAPTQITALNGLFFPWIRELMLARPERSPSGARAEDRIWNNGQRQVTPFENTAKKATQSGGQKFWRMAPLQAPSWMEVDIRPTALLVYGANGIPVEPPTYEQLRNSASKGNVWCPWKCLVRWKEGSDIRSAVVDIGAGQIFSVPPTTQVSLDILIPSEDPEVLENVIAPPDVAIRRAVCRIQAKVTCVYSSSGNHAKYSEVYYLERGAPGGSVGGQFWMPEGTRSVQARFSNVADIFADLTPKGDVRAALRTESARVPQGIAVDAAYPSPNVPMTFEGGDGTSTRRTEVFPSSVWNVVRVQNPVGSAAEALHSVVCAELDL